MGRRDARVQGTARRPHPTVARRVAAVVAGFLVVAGTTTVFDASSTVFGSAPPTETLSCNDTYVGSGTSGDWDSAANWSAGVPDGADVNACIIGNADVTLTGASFSVAELTVSSGSSLTIGTIAPATAPTAADSTAADSTAADSTATDSTATAIPVAAPHGPADSPAGAGAAAASLNISSGLQNGGSLTVGAAGTSGHPALSLNGPITNSGTVTVDGTVSVGGGAATAVENTGTIGVAPGGQVIADEAAAITNEPQGLLAFGIDGPPASVNAFGRITGGTLALGGTAAAVFEGGFTPPSGAEYFVGSGPATGTFASVANGATADYSHADRIGLIGGAPAATTATRVTSSVPPGSLVGQSVQFTAVVTSPSGAGPTGSVSFSAGDLLLGSSPVTTSPAGVTSATVATSHLPVGHPTITATYGGDVRFGASRSAELTQVVNPDPTALSITPSVPSPVAGQSLTDTATLAPSSRNAEPPTGSVSFTDDGSPVPGCQSLPLPDVAPFRAGCTETFGSGATHAIVATYSGDADNAGSTASLLQTVGQIATMTAVSSSTPSNVYGQTAVVTATITPTASAGVSPSGTVTFADGSSPLGTVEVSTTGGLTTASLDTSSLGEGAHFVTATYSGDPTFATSTTATALIVKVAEAPTTVTVSDASTRSVVGQTVVFTASITSPASGVTGTVQFADDGDLIGSGAVSGGQATFAISSLALGGHHITALYEGDDNFVGGSSTNTVTQTVDPSPTSTGVTSAHDPGLVGQTIAYTATVTVPAPGSGTPTGTVSFSDGGSPIAGCQGLALAPAPPLVATCPQAYDSIGQQDITASYSGDTNFTASAGAMTEALSPVSTTTTLAPSPAASTSGQSVTLTATVSPDIGNGGPGRDGVVHPQWDSARNLRRVDDQRHQRRQHAPHHASPRDGLGDCVVRRQSRLPRQLVRRGHVSNRDEGVHHTRAVGRGQSHHRGRADDAHGDGLPGHGIRRDRHGHVLRQ